ncbi:MucR family transcriptional regulator [Caulobacter hibisci]|uniref:MucR family transcriptional regulator n=1 Tax=Caulobacter hibisci TaxID=2035993 RepID=A0ABS0SWA5_9CAUL|nr:MucR family transcriptional regulator [Caulobacter hibisci]MBI1683927.1 MucR family transcriptional regulator [Caulobacter hibisci]
MEEEIPLVELTASIVAAFVGGNAVSAADMPGLIRSVHGALAAVGAPQAAAPEPKEPAVPVRRSVTPDYLVCLEDGRRFKSLKRHLRTQYDLSPEDYREKWGLPSDYPMVAPNYAKARSDLARQMGLGQAGRGARTARKA